MVQGTIFNIFKKCNENIHMHIFIYALNHFVVYLKLTQHCKLTIFQLKMKFEAYFMTIIVTTNIQHKCYKHWWQ